MARYDKTNLPKFPGETGTRWREAALRPQLDYFWLRTRPAKLGKGYRRVEGEINVRLGAPFFIFGIGQGYWYPVIADGNRLWVYSDRDRGEGCVVTYADGKEGTPLSANIEAELRQALQDVQQASLTLQHLLENLNQ
jgi:hypothetical protein